MTAPRALNRPRPVTVRVGPDGAPRAVAGTAVEAVLETWIVEDRWWTGRPLRRRYFEVVTVAGRCRVVFRDLATGRWMAQRD